MRIEELQVGRSYLMDDGRIVRLVHEFPAPDGHKRVRFDIVEGEAAGSLDMSLREFAEKATSERP